MSLNFPVDTSVQLSYSSFPFATPNLDNFTTSNYVSNISNILDNKINTKQNILTAATNLLGIGSSISALDYNKITLNVPSTFPPTMTDIYSKTESDNISNANSNYTRITSNILSNLIITKQNTLTTATTLLGIGSNITLINYNTLSNLPSTFTPTMTNIYNRTESDGRYLQLTGGILTSNLDISYANPILTIRAANENQTAILYLSTPANLSGALKTAIIAEGLTNWSRSKLHFCLNNTANNTDSATIADARMTIIPSGNIGISNANPVSRLTINQHPAYNNSFDFSTCPITITNINPTSSSVLNDPKPILYLCREGTVGQAFGSKATFNLCRYENAGSSNIGSRTRLDLALTHDNFNDVNIMSIRSDGNVGIGTTNPHNNFDVFGTNCKFAIRATDENQSATLYLGTGHLGINVYKTALIAEGNTGFSRSKLHFCLNNTTNNTDSATIANARMTIRQDGNVGIGITDPTYKLNVNGSINSTSLWQNGTQIDFSSYATNTNLTNNYYTKTTTDNLLNNKQNTLTFNSPLSLTGNTLSFNESAITTLTNFYNKTTSDGIYVKIQSDTFVQKSGDTITGSLIVNNVIYGNNGINIVGNYVGSINVAKRATFSFVPLVNLSRRQYVLPLTYINGNGSGYGTQYIFRVHVWTSTGDFGASGNDVETMSYFVFLSPYDGMKIRIETIYNNSNGSLIQSHTATSLLYNGAPTTGGASEKYCVIENISGY